MSEGLTHVPEGPVPASQGGARLLDLIRVQARLRAPGGCPWDAEQTHQTLARHLLEETHELLEAIDAEDSDAIRDELGDLLLQVTFHAQIAADDGRWDVDDVAQGLVEKLIHRHPHVFGDADAQTPEDVNAHWQRTKAVEKQRESVTDGIPLGQPGLALAAKLAGRVRTGGVAVGLPRGEGIGYELLELAARAEAAGIDPETALRAAARVFRDAIRAAEGVGAADTD